MSRLSIVIPVYNEGDNILVALREIAEKLTVSATILLVYDAPEDTTVEPVQRIMGDFSLPLKLVKNAYGRGALNAIKTGLEAAQTEYVIVTMADLSDPPEVMNDMIRKADETGASIVCASRYMRGGAQIGGPRLKGFLSRTAGLLLCWVARLPTHDPTNSFKLYRKSFLETVTIESDGGFELGIELVVKARANKQIIAEVPTTWRDRVAGKSNFKLWKWLPKYLRWFFYAFTHR